MGLFKWLKRQTLEEGLEEDIRILKDRFSNFGMPIEIERIKVTKGFLEPTLCWADILFHCNNIQQYIEKSKEVENIIENEFSYGAPQRRIKRFGDNRVRFELDHLKIENINDFSYKYKKKSSDHHYTYTSLRRRMELTLSDNSGKILSYAELSPPETPSPILIALTPYNFDDDSYDDKMPPIIMSSERGDEIRVNVSSLKKDKKNIDFCYVYRIKNYSLNERLKK